MSAADSPVLRRWHERLTNWALWVVGADSLGGGSAYDGEHGEGAPRPPQPLVGPALDTEMLVQQLTPDHQGAIKAVYVWSGPVIERAKALGVHADTMRDRVTQAMWKLEELDQRRKLTRVRVAATNNA